MPGDPVTELSELSHSFGVASARRKLHLLKALSQRERFSLRQLELLQDTLCFIRAYPDNPRVLAKVKSRIESLLAQVRRYRSRNPDSVSLLNSGLPGGSNSYPYSYGVVKRLAELYPGELEFDWEELEDEGPLNDALECLIAPAEARGLEDEELTLAQWFDTVRGSSQTDLEDFLKLVGNASLSFQEQGHVFDSCNAPIRLSLDGPGRGKAELVADGDIHYQRRAPGRDVFRRSDIRKPLPAFRRLSSPAGQRMIDLSLKSLCVRNLEIYPLIYANSRDVTEVECGRGIRIVLVGVLPEFRTVPEALFFFLILKNGVPVAYGPASVFMGVCEMGINLFPEFRGMEIRYIYTQFMRTLFHLARVRFFYLVPYAMGVDNPDAIRSGAFWFYRKLGFRASNPAVEALAREEEAIMRKAPGHRSSPAVLRRLSHTHVHLDFSGGKIRRFDYGKLSQAASRLINERYRGHRRRARRGTVSRLVRTLGIPSYSSWSPGEKRAMEQLAPVLCLVPDLASWSLRERTAIARAIRGRGGNHERPYLLALSAVPRLGRVLGEISRL